MDTKKPWMSKTLWLGLLTAALPFCPPVQAWVIANPEAWSALVGVAFMGIRAVTEKKLSIR